MSSTNEEIPTLPPSLPSKSKTSHLEFRNTDLVSRLLAATPPYLYNMPLVPHSYFFSEMLRSLVQGKTEAAAARMSSTTTVPPHQRRPRKRTWSSHTRLEQLPPKQSLPNSNEMPPPPPNWPLKPMPPPPLEKTEQFDPKLTDRPLELTMNKIPFNNNTKLPENQSSEIQIQKLNEIQNQIPFMFPPPPPTQENNPGDLILPPPPPIWYPPLYPGPYGIDPLHFFIDLRVSGHIYDRKNPTTKDPTNIPHTSLGISNPLSYPNSTITSPDENINFINRDLLMKQSRHASAFSVPTPSLTRNDPLNLSGAVNSKYQIQPTTNKHNEKPNSKFDIKSMGFDTDTDSDRNNSTNYILKNLSNIYETVHNAKPKDECMDLTSPKHESVNSKDDEIKNEDNKDEVVAVEDDEEEKKKKCKDLRALIGLELVVDYVKHEVKPGEGEQCNSDDSSSSIRSEMESNVSSPIVEVVTIPDIENRI